MRRSSRAVLTASSLLLTHAIPLAADAVPSQRVYYDEQGRLRGLADGEANRIPGYSHAGYEGGVASMPLGWITAWPGLRCSLQ